MLNLTASYIELEVVYCPSKYIDYVQYDYAFV